MGASVVRKNIDKSKLITNDMGIETLPKGEGKKK